MSIAVLDDHQRCARDFADRDALGESVDVVHEHLTGDALVERLAGAQVVTSDIVSLHVRLRERTRGIVAAPELAAMPTRSILVNTSRGPLVDEDALVASLEHGPLGAAGLDVFDEEPLPATHRLRRMPNVVLAPHLGYVTRGSYATYFADAVEDIAAGRAGRPVRVVGGAG